MPSVVGLLEERERGARQRVEVLCEEADRVLAELRDAELFWERFRDCAGGSRRGSRWSGRWC